MCWRRASGFCADGDRKQPPLSEIAISAAHPSRCSKVVLGGAFDGIRSFGEKWRQKSFVNFKGVRLRIWGLLVASCVRVLIEVVYFFAKKREKMFL
jgi:hypothetical protein